MSPDGSRKKSRGVCVFVHTCVYTWSCPSDLEEPPGASLWVRVSGAAMGAAPAPHLLRGARQGRCVVPPSAHPPRALCHPLGAGLRVALATAGISRMSQRVCSWFPIQLSQAGGGVASTWSASRPVRGGQGREAARQGRRPGHRPEQLPQLGHLPHGGKQGLSPDCL